MKKKKYYTSKVSIGNIFKTDGIDNFSLYAGIVEGLRRKTVKWSEDSETWYWLELKKETSWKSCSVVCMSTEKLVTKCLESFLITEFVSELARKSAEYHANR